MQLTYRGVRYNYNPVQVETRAGAIAGKYRGAALKFRTSAAKVPVLKSTLDLFYRGASYRVNSAQTGESGVVLQAPVNLTYRGFNYTLGEFQPAAAVQTDTIADQARVLVMQRRQRDDRREESVLERFEAAIGASENTWVIYERPNTAMG